MGQYVDEPRGQVSGGGGIGEMIGGKAISLEELDQGA